MWVSKLTRKGQKIGSCKIMQKSMAKTKHLGPKIPKKPRKRNPIKTPIKLQNNKILPVIKKVNSRLDLPRTTKTEIKELKIYYRLRKTTANLLR